MHSNPPEIHRGHCVTPDRVTSSRHREIGIHRQHSPGKTPPQLAPPQLALRGPRPSNPGVDRAKTCRISDYTPPQRAPPSRGPPRSRRHSLAEIPSNSPIQINIRRQSSSRERSSSHPCHSNGKSNESKNDNQKPSRRRSLVGRRIQETSTARCRESDRSEFGHYGQSCAEEHPSSAKKHNTARMSEDKLKRKVERSGSISSGHDTKCSSNSDGSRDAMYRSGGSRSNDLVVRRLSVDDANLSFLRLQEQVDSLNLVVPDSNSRIHARPKFAPPPTRCKLVVQRSHSMEVSSHHSMISKLKRSPPPNLSRARSTDESTSRKSDSTCFQSPPPPPPPRQLSCPPRRRNSIAGGVIPQLGHAASIHNPRSCGVESELIGGVGKFSHANTDVSPLKPPSLSPQTLDTVDAARLANDSIIANKKILDKIQRSNQVTNMPYTDSMGDSGVYTGEIDQESRRPHGKGKMKYENGIFYEGKWVNGAQDAQAAIQRERILSGFTSWKGKSGKGKGGSEGCSTTRVYGMEWVDFKGMSGKYTGAINKDEIPHGRGKLCYDFGLIAEGNWVNGVLDDGAGMSAFGASMGMGMGMDMGMGMSLGGYGAPIGGTGTRAVFDEDGTMVSGLGMMSIGGIGVRRSTQPGFVYHTQRRSSS